MEIERLPEELLTEVISRTSPRDACRAAAVSPALRAAADSDAVWSRFLPRDLPRLAEKEIPSAPLSSKGLFQRLAAQPALLPGKLVSMRLDRATGAKCYTLSARSLHVSWGDTACYWRWIHVDVDDYCATRGKRFSEAAQLVGVYWLEIRGRIESKMLSKNTAYTARMVFKLTDAPYRLDHPFQEGSVSVGRRKSTRKVCLQACVNGDADAVAAGAPPYHILPPVSWRPRVLLPRRRADGWMEVELGSFYNEERVDGEVSISLKEIKGGIWKSGLIVRAIEITTNQPTKRKLTRKKEIASVRNKPEELLGLYVDHPN